MVSRRTRARISFVGSVAGLILTVFVLRRFSGEGRNSFSVYPGWLALGSVSRVAYCRAYDRDLGGIRTSRWRRVSVAAVRFLLGLGFALAIRESSESSSIRQNVSLGEKVGRTGYRLWYGVLRPLPDTDE
jgi:hypothetical protein